MDKNCHIGSQRQTHSRIKRNSELRSGLSHERSRCYACGANLTVSAAMGIPISVVTVPVVAVLASVGVPTPTVRMQSHTFFLLSG